MNDWNIGGYSVGGNLGKGAYGEVKSCVNEKTKEKVAVKRCADIFSVFPQKVQKCLREVEILSKVDCPNIVKMKEVKKASLKIDFGIYIVLERMPFDLSKLFHSNEYLVPIQTKKLLYEILIGVNYLHSRKIIHRDIKPANVLISNHCSVRICDFGLSRSIFSLKDTRYTEKYHQDYIKPNPSEQGEEEDIDDVAEENFSLQPLERSPKSFYNGKVERFGKRYYSDHPLHKTLLCASPPRLSQVVSSFTAESIKPMVEVDIVKKSTILEERKEKRERQTLPKKEGLASKEINLTNHIGTRWYRAPEIILLEKYYDSSIDIWSIGCIFGELLQMQQDVVDNQFFRSPLFPGEACFPLSYSKKDREDSLFIKNDQLSLIINGIGGLCEDDVSFLQRKSLKGYLLRVKPRGSSTLYDLFSKVDPEALNLLKQMLQFNPDRRITAKQALSHPYFEEIRDPQREVEGEPLKLDSDCMFNDQYKMLLSYCNQH